MRTQQAARRVARGLWLLALLLGPQAASSQSADQSVTVTVEQVTDGTATRYRYRVTNNGSVPVVALSIGYDHWQGTAELSLAPVGWTLQGGVPTSSRAAPPGWSTRFVVTEGEPVAALEWRNDGGPSADIPPGGTALFAVSLPAADAAYRAGHFDAILGDSTHVSAPLTVGTVPEPAAPPSSKSGCGNAAGPASMAGLLALLGLGRRRRGASSGGG